MRRFGGDPGVLVGGAYGRGALFRYGETPELAVERDALLRYVTSRATEQFLAGVAHLSYQLRTADAAGRAGLSGPGPASSRAWLSSPRLSGGRDDLQDGVHRRAAPMPFERGDDERIVFPPSQTRGHLRRRERQLHGLEAGDDLPARARPHGAGMAREGTAAESRRVGR